ncbi:MAG TPA: S8 family serine peptidase [Pseudoneobacillus sp.]|nr:S8 family serine peptidase [Pseudoneobacillus sp.]
MKKGKRRMKPVLIGALALMMATPFNVLAAGPPQVPTQKDQIQKINSQMIDQVKTLLGKQDTAYIDKGLDTKTTKLVKVIVELKESTQQGIAAQSIEAQQNTLIQSFNKQGLGITVGRTYQTVFNGMSMTIPGNKISELAANQNVKAIYQDDVVTATPINSDEESDGAPYIGAHEMNDAGYTGKGMKVGVIDTGIDYKHPDLMDAYKGGYDFVDNDKDPYETSPDDGYGSDGVTSHGTHVSGTIAGRNVSGHGVRGVAPEADIYAYRVLGAGGSGLMSTVIAGIEKSVEDGMDVINLSLGHNEPNPYSPDSIAVNNAILAGVTVVVSNGNSGAEGRYSVGSPGASDMAISVGASTLPSTRYTGDVTISYPDPSDTQKITNQQDSSATEPTAQTATKTTNFPIRVMAWNKNDGPEGYAKSLQGVPLVYVGNGDITGYKSNVKGKAVLIARGDIPLVDKINNAKAAGAVAAFIFNKDAATMGPLTYFLGAGDYPPTYSMSEEAGMELLKAIEAYPGKELTLDSLGTIQPVLEPGDDVASFSSRGPTANMNIKPDVVAPGVHIRSSVAKYGGDYTEAYEAWDGTSMAAPHVTGLSVLLKQAHPEYSPFDVKAALMNTAKVLETPKYTMFDQGAGRVQGYNALTTEALAMVLEQSKADGDRDEQYESADHYTGSVLFGSMEAYSNDPITKKKSVLLKDVAGKAQDYTVRYEMTAPENTNNVTLTTPDTVHVDANGETNFDVSVNVPAGTPTGEYQGYIYLTNTETGAESHLPFVSYVGDVDMGDGFLNVEVNNPNFSPDGNGVLDTLPINFELKDSAEVVIGELFDNNTGVYMGWAFGYIADEDHPALEAGKHTFEWDGTFSNPFYTGLAPDGSYSIALVGFSKYPKSESDVPFIKWVDSDLYLQTQAPNVIVKEADYVAQADTYHLTGRVEDLYTSHGKGDQVKVTYEMRHISDDFNVPHKFTYGFFFANADGTFEADIKVDSGYSIISILGTTPAFDYLGTPGIANPSRLNLHVGQPTQFFVTPNRDIKLGEEFDVTVDARYVKNFIGGDIEFMVEEESLKFLGAEATNEIKSHGDVSLVVKDLGVTGDILETYPIIGYPGPDPIPGEGSGTTGPMHSYKVGLALKGLVDGIDGNISYIKLKFKATSNIEKVNLDHPIMVNDSSIAVLKNGKEELVSQQFAVDGALALHAPNQNITGHVSSLSPEAIEGGADYSKKGIKVYASWDGYYNYYTNNYSGGNTVEGVVNPDGSFIIENLPADKTFTIRLLVPGHLPATMEGFQLLKNEEGYYVPSDVEVTWNSRMLAGNLNNDNKINLLDLAIVSRHYGMENPTVELGDINQDGVIDILDLSYVTTNYGQDNENNSGWGVTIPIPERPMN